MAIAELPRLVSVFQVGAPAVVAMAPAVKAVEPATPTAPRSSSLACVVLAVAPELGVVLLPLAVCALSKLELASRPRYSSASTARLATAGWVIVRLSGPAL